VVRRKGRLGKGKRRRALVARKKYRRRKKKKVSAKSRRVRIKRRTSKARATRYRRKCDARVRKILARLKVGPKKRASAVKRIKRRSGLRKKLGGIVGILKSGRFPGIIAKNPRRRRRRLRSARRRARNYSHWIPSYRNPGYTGRYTMNPSNVLKSVTRGFNYRVVASALPVVGGALGNAVVSGAVSGYLPSFLASGPGNLAVGLGTAGLLGAGAGMVSPKVGGAVFMGGVIEVLTRGIKRYILPAVGLSGMMGMGCAGMGCVGDYGSDLMLGSQIPDYAQATGLDNNGLGDYLTTGNAASARPLGDYLTTQNAAMARSLGDYPVEDVAGDELTHTY